ncbi:MAG TPA: metallophosphoesterase, partial [Candidatus Krumholzibacterium sp.]|nr:metallophosphoesterase [Candidatus Krumholzibacterium sp.]
MRLFVCSDIHGNLRAFDAVLSVYREEGPFEFLFLGDAVGYGAHPDAVLDRLLNLPRATLLLGNHEWALLERLERGDMNELAARAIAWTEVALKGRYDKDLIKRFSLSGGDGRYRADHATPMGRGYWEYIYSMYDAEEIFDNYDDRLCFIGHTHVPIVYNSKGETLQVEDGTVVPMEPGVRYVV